LLDVVADDEGLDVVVCGAIVGLFDIENDSDGHVETKLETFVSHVATSCQIKCHGKSLDR